MSAREVMKSVGLTEADCDCVEQAFAATGWVVVPKDLLSRLEEERDSWKSAHDTCMRQLAAARGEVRVMYKVQDTGGDHSQKAAKGEA